MDTGQKMRRLQSRLYTGGFGIILFSVWSGIRDIQILFEMMREQSLDVSEVLSEETIRIIMRVLILVVIGGSTLLYLYIGRRAMQVSLGKKKGNLYLVFAVLVLISSCATYFENLKSQVWLQVPDMEQIVLTVIDVTATLILADVIVCSLLLKRMRRQLCR